MGALLFSERTYLAGWRLDAYQARLWEIVLKAVAGYVAVSGALVAALKYLDERAAHTEIAEREGRKDFLAKRQEVYFRLVNALSEITNCDPGDEEWQPANNAFWKIYWGEIVLVSDTAVADAVENFSEALWNYKGEEKEKLSRLIRATVRACRASLGETWNFEQSAIPESTFRSIIERFKR